MGVDARREHRVVVDTKLSVLPHVRMLMTGTPVMKDSSTSRALKGRNFILDIQINARIEYFPILERCDCQGFRRENQVYRRG